ncbi:MAG: STAS domain-containing protein [Polyangia bacterium]
MGKLRLENRIPILKLYENLIVVVQGVLTDAMVNQLREDIPRALDRHEVSGIVVTVDTIDVMDSYMARMIHDLSVTARLMGCETVICGIGSLVAGTLVDMGMDLGGVPTERNLERALERLAQLRRAARARLRAESATEPEREEAKDEDGQTERTGARRRSAGSRGRRRAGAGTREDDGRSDGDLE